jgi:hypothetical protein
VTDEQFLTPEEVSERYRGRITVGTLRNWRSMRIGPCYVKHGRVILYPVSALDEFDRQNLVRCRASKSNGSVEREQNI